MQLSLAFITLLVVGEIAATTDYQCWNFKSTNDIRDRYLKAVNKLRTDIVNGMVEGKNGKCPAGKNIYKLFWDCLLENEAQKAVDKCDEKVQAPADLAMVIKKLPLDTCNTNPLFKKTVDEWWNVVKGVDVDQTNPPTSSSALQSFAALAHGDATRIGCAQKNCNGNLFMACMVYNKAPAEGQPIYEAGSGCSGPTECTTYQGSKCSNKMCVAGYIDSTKTTAAPQPPDQTTTPLITTPVTAPPVPTTTPLFPGKRDPGHGDNSPLYAPQVDNPYF
ncbi:hypothetical protein Y032_0105g3671 [Ancylostoma ceylanicum]|uniref:SCP domain-containing protein n=1 Tax=Ancylostoma ceylanicum TaxID=53326 RepID=A0A016TG41_9BILA|nr:hypothetical protein Y032_0105g3671 [Ancylostoma ceylanicum]